MQTICLSRRRLLTSTGLSAVALSMAACGQTASNGTVTTVTSGAAYVSAIATGLSDLEPELLALGNVPTPAKVTLDASIAAIQKSAAAISANAATPGQSDLQLFFGTVTPIINNVLPLIPGGSALLATAEAIEALVPIAAAAFAFALPASAKPRATPSVAPDVALATIRAYHVAHPAPVKR